MNSTEQLLRGFCGEIVFVKCCVAACGCVSRGVGAHSCVCVWFTHSTGLRRGHDERISPIEWHLFVYIPDMLQGDRETDTIILPGLSVHHSMPPAPHNLSTTSQIDRGWCSECRNYYRSKAIWLVESTMLGVFAQFKDVTSGSGELWWEFSPFYDILQTKWSIDRLKQ